MPTGTTRDVIAGVRAAAGRGRKPDRPDTWVSRWGDMIAAVAEMPGVWRRKEGGYRIRGRVRDPKTGAMRGVNRALPDCKRARDAAAILSAELDRVRAEGSSTPTRAALPTFADWAVTVFQRKIAEGKIVAASGREKWASILEHHLIPAFGPTFVDQLTREDIDRWKVGQLLAPRTKTKSAKPGKERKLEGGRYSPQTINGILAILRQITAAASEAFNLRDVARSVENVSTRGHRTYTYEAPNAIKPADVPRFLGAMRATFPQHYAFVFLGFTTGLRPSSLRPLRRRGSHADVKWDDGRLLVRRSHTHKGEVMDETKTARDQVLELDPEQVSVLRWHCERLEAYAAKAEADGELAIAGALRASDLLFPAPPTKWSRGGGFRSRSSLVRAFDAVGKAIGLGYEVSPRAMRRTFQDLARAAELKDVVTRSISGHATPAMQRHYSTVNDSEMREGIAKVIDIATGRERRAA